MKASSLRNIYSRLLVALLVLVAFVGCLALVGCGSNDESDGQNSTSSEAEPLPERPDVSAQVEERIASMTREQKVAQLFILTPEALTDVDVATLGGQKTQEGLKSYPLGGLIYAKQNLISPEQTKIMLGNTKNFAKTDNGVPIFLCVEEEGGLMAPIGGNEGFTTDNVGDMAIIGATGDTSIAERTAQSIGGYLRELGFNFNFAPVADIGDNPDSPDMARRSYSSDAKTAGAMVKAAITGFERANMVCCAKHFPGIGSAVLDSGTGTLYSYKSKDELNNNELIPFKDAIEVKVPCIMVGNIALSSLENSDQVASVNPAIVQGILRDQLGFTGIVITDDLSAIPADDLPAPADLGVAVLEAGGDMILKPADFHATYNGILNALNTGALDESRIDESLTRILTVKYQYL